MSSLSPRLETVLDRVLTLHGLRVEPVGAAAPRAEGQCVVVRSSVEGRRSAWVLVDERDTRVGRVEVVVRDDVLWLDRLSVTLGVVPVGVVCDTVEVLQEVAAEAEVRAVRACPVDPCALQVPWQSLGLEPLHDGLLEWEWGGERPTVAEGGEGTLYTLAESSLDGPEAPAAPPSRSPQVPVAVLAPGVGLAGDRFVVRERLGRGAMGEVWAVDDRRLGASVALKVMRPEHVGIARYRSRFEHEVRITAQLDHPAIVSVIDTGALSDGRVWFVMDRVRGDDLLQVQLRSRPARPLEEPARFDAWVRRTAGHLLVVCRAVASAHERGVVHRDIKPSNIMVGRFGEVLLMDWGVARNLGEDDACLDDELAPIVLVSTAPQQTTRFGQRVGTPAYMSPEQARGEARTVGPAADVFALGVTLIEALTGELPVRRGGALDPGPLAALLERGHVAPPLRDLITRATASDPAARPSAVALSTSLERFLDGSLRREQAEAAFVDAIAQIPETEVLRERAREIEAEAAQALALAPRHGPAEPRMVGWRLEDQALELRAEAAVAEAKLERGLASVLELWDGHQGARAALVDLYVSRADRAERSGDRDQRAAAEAALRETRAPRALTYLQAQAAVSLVTDPPGALVVAHRQAPVDRRLATVESVSLGRTPVRAHTLAPGSWILELRAPGRLPVRYPVYVRRGEHWDGVPPGEAEPMPIALPRNGELGPDDCYVPAGWARFGGDPRAPDAVAACRMWLDAMVVRRYPVTLDEWFAWVDTGPEVTPHMVLGVAESRASKQGGFWRVPGGYWASNHEDPTPSSGRVPATWMNAAAGMAYAQWEAQRTGRPWMLPTEWMWEKAARGVDGRFFPWGDFFDGAWAVSGEREGLLRAVPVDVPTGDVGPYGIAHMAGQRRAFCQTIYRKDGGVVDGGRHPLPGPGTVVPGAWYCARGGTAASRADFSRSAGRYASRLEVTYGSSGIRLFAAYHPAAEPA